MTNFKNERGDPKDPADIKKLIKEYDELCVNKVSNLD